MGHRLSKTAANSIAAKTNKPSANENLLLNTTTTATTTNIIPIPSGNTQHQFLGPTINLQIQESPSTSCSINTSASTDSSASNHITTTAAAAGILQQQQQQQHQYSTNNSISSSLTSVNNLSCGRQIIIKIQLAKMENGNETTRTATPSSLSTPSLSSSVSQHQQQQLRQDASLTTTPSDCNLNSTEQLATTITAVGTQFLNLTLNSSSNDSSTSNCNSVSNTNTTIATAATTTSTSTTPPSATLLRTAGISLNKNNNYLNSNNAATSGSTSSSTNINNSIISMSRINNERPERYNSLQFNDEIVEKNIGEIVEYCEVLEDHLQQPQTSSSSYSNTKMLSINEEPDNDVNVCCRRKSKSLATNGASSMSSGNNTGAKTKSRCRKCSCRDAFKRFLDPSHSRSSNKVNKQQKEQKRSKSQDRHSINNPILNNKKQQPQQPQRNSIHSTNMSPNAINSTSAAPTTSDIVVPTPPPVSNHQVSLWRSGSTAGGGSNVIIPLATPAPSQFVVVQCAIVNPSSAAALHNNLPTAQSTTPNSSLNLLSITAQDLSPSISTSSSSNDLMVKVPSNGARSHESASGAIGPIVHSQVDFVHYLVPDLERITNSSFYWGKMDRYEAERLLEGKPEGTFLLRDSAQEEFLFSVTFRKYGRSLHARIEQSDHRFSFDCHDPCVFTAPTVTGLLEHYKDPACVMFFEPMLTIPLHRRNCFSLQKLCRATIVSNTTYDGINELELPARLKSYLKEYHYKQKLRVKSNEPHYGIHCK